MSAVSDVERSTTRFREYLGIPLMLVLPVALTTLGYLLHHIVKYRISVGFYLKLIVALVMLTVGYSAEAYGLFKNLKGHWFEELTIPNQVFYSYSYTSLALRPIPTLLYTWQFFEVVNSVN
jgi:hypothetical protein